MNTYRKIDDSTLEVTKPAPVSDPVVATYNLDTLKRQELSILQSLNEFVEARKKELTEVREFITKAEELGIKSSAEIAQPILDESIN